MTTTATPVTEHSTGTRCQNQATDTTVCAAPKGIRLNKPDQWKFTVMLLCLAAVILAQWLFVCMIGLEMDSFVSLNANELKLAKNVTNLTRMVNDYPAELRLI